MIKLKPCPFCGCEDNVGISYTENVEAYVKCYQCGVTTGAYSTAEKAAGAWNRSEK